jgi:small redox-active disulfide protein 2
MDVKILGTGCPNCKRLERLAHDVLAEMGVAATLTKVTNMADILAYDILGTPGLVIDGRVVSSGRIPSKAEVTTWVANALGRGEG